MIQSRKPIERNIMMSRLYSVLATLSTYGMFISLFFFNGKMYCEFFLGMKTNLIAYLLLLVLLFGFTSLRTLFNQLKEHCKINENS
jgi:hypothetical protein